MIGNRDIRDRLMNVPMPARDWEKRMIAAILRHSQEEQGSLAVFITMIVGMFHRHQFLGPVLATVLLGMTYFVQPINLYGAKVAEYEEAVLYLEEITDVAAYEIDFDAWTSSWILEY